MNYLTSILLLLLCCTECLTQTTRTSTNTITATEAGSTITNFVSYTEYPTPTYDNSTNHSRPDSNGGGNKTAIAVGVSVGAVIVLSAIGIFIFRKWKLRPTHKFETKMHPNNHFAPRQRLSNRDDTVFLRELDEE